MCDCGRTLIVMVHSMTKLSAERLRELRELGKAYLVEDEYLALFDHIAIVEAERDELQAERGAMLRAAQTLIVALKS